MILKKETNNLSIASPSNGFFHPGLGEVIYPSYTNESFFKSSKRDKLHYAIALCDKVELMNIPVKNFEYFNKDTIGGFNFNQFNSCLLSDLNLQHLLSIDTYNIIDLLIPIKEHYRIMKSRITKENYLILKYRSEKYTLQEIGKMYGVTRERIRQRESIALERLERFIEIASFTLFTVNDYLPLEELEGLFEEEDIGVIEYLFEQHKEYKFIRELNKVIHNSKLRTKEVRIYVESCFEEDFVEEEYLVFIEEELKEKGINYLESSDLKYYLLESNYGLIENTFIRLNRYINPYLYIIKTRFKKGIEIFQTKSSDDYKDLIKITSTLFPSVKLVDSNRAIYVRLTESLISIDRSIMIHQDNLTNNPTDIKFLVNYMERSNIDTFSFTELYDKHKKTLNTLNINNRYYLRALLQLGYNQNYKFTRDYIIKTGGEFVSASDNIINEVWEYRKPIYSKELRKRYPYLSEIMFYGPLYNSLEILNWGHARYLHKDNLPIISSKDKIKHKIEEELKIKGILSRTEFIRIIAKFVEPYDYHLDNNLSVEPFINYYFKDDFHYKHEMVHLYSEDKYKDYKLYFSLYFRDAEKINIGELNNLGRKKQLSYNSKQSILSDIMKNYLRVDNSEFISLQQFDIQKRDIVIIKDEIINLLEFEDIISPIDIVSKVPLPSLGFNWNEYSLISFIRLFLNNKLLFIPTGVHHSLTKWGVITFAKGSRNISQVIYNYLQKLGITRISEHELYKHLIKLKIINGRIPHEVYKSEMFKINNGIVQLL